MVGAAGHLLERSIVDRMVGQPGRLVFEGGPVLEPPLVQDKAKRRPVAVEGAVLDTVAVCPPLSIVEQSRLKELKARERARLAPEEAKARERFIAAKANKLAARTGMPERAARAVVIRQCEGVLRPDIVLPFDDPSWPAAPSATCWRTRNASRARPWRIRWRASDYGRCCAKIMRRADGTPWIHSFAHGRTIYELKYNAAASARRWRRRRRTRWWRSLPRLAAVADLDAVETEELRQLAKKLSGVGLRAINATLKAAQQQHARCAAPRLRAIAGPAQRHDPRPRIQAPIPDDPWLPEMGVLNEVIGAVEAVMPPARDIDDDATPVRKFRIPGTHAFTDANDAENQKETRNDQAAAARAMGALQDERNGSRRDDRAAHRLSTPWTRTATSVRCTCQRRSCGISCGGTTVCCR